jgi:hypothetical protein
MQSGNIAVTPDQNTADDGLWDDLSVISPQGVNPTGPDSAATVILTESDYYGCLQFDAIGESAAVVFQLPHMYKIGTDIKPHIHVVRNDGSDNVGNVEFEAKFRVVPLRGTAFAWTAYSDGNISVQPADGAGKSGIISWTLANSTYSFGISDQIIMILRRKGLTTGSVALTSADVHGQKGQLGSVNEASL